MGSTRTSKGNRISVDETGNSTKVLLGAAGEFIGNWESVIDYTTAAVAIKGDNVTDGTLYIESSQDGGVTVNSVPFTVSDATFDLPHIWNVVETDIRVRYVNGTTAQTGHFQLQTKYSNGQELGLLQNAGDSITEDTDVQVVKSVTTGRQPDGAYRNDPHNGVAIRTEALLAGGATFTSDWVDTDGYNVIETHVESDVTSEKNGIVFEFTDDLSGTPISRFEEEFSFGTSEVSAGSREIFLRPKMVGFRVKYTNNGAAQGSFLLQTDLKTNGIIKDTSIPPTVLFAAKRPTDPSIPSGGAVTIHATLNVEANVNDSGWLSVKEFGGGSLVNVIGDVSLEIYLLNASDSDGNNWQGNSIPALVTSAGFSSTIGAAFFDDFFRIVVVNVSGTTADEFSVKAQALQTAAPPVFTSIDQDVFGFFPAPLNRSVIVGSDENGAYGNATITTTTNDAGSYNSLNVVSGARPSQLAGRLKVSEVVDTTVSVLQRTITTDKTFYVTDIILTIDNTDNSNTGRVNLRDGLTVAGAIVLPLLIQESPTNESAVQVLTHQFADPIEFSTGLFIEEGAGINEITGVIIGYEE